jgi:hypothetical protein
MEKIAGKLSFLRLCDKGTEEVLPYCIKLSIFEPLLLFWGT